MLMVQRTKEIGSLKQKVASKLPDQAIVKQPNTEVPISKIGIPKPLPEPSFYLNEYLPLTDKVTALQQRKEELKQKRLLRDLQQNTK
jgi:hypothetical protein